MSDVLLQAEGLCKHFGELQVCRNLNLEIESGELHAIIGPNGAGKTTVLNLLTGLLAPDSGALFLNNRNITKTSVPERANLGLARAFQVTSLFNKFTVRENLMLAVQAQQKSGFRFWTNAAHDKKLVESADEFVEQMGLTERAMVLAGSLSHGERRQLEMGMALATKPDMLLLDEPMAGLGPGGSLKLCELIEGLKGGVTILLVEHDTHAVFALADRISVLVQGEVVATDTPQLIKANSLVQEAYLGGV
ncbi:MAG: ABC transporter ATP-binding protein [Desulfocapsa sp.]|nr:ABC transporter ATP-binding protein [Desulfocapsa sp.]